jgi:hypothetical protein
VDVSAGPLLNKIADNLEIYSRKIKIRVMKRMTSLVTEINKH